MSLPHEGSAPLRPVAVSASKQRQKRLALALRANLARRKQQKDNQKTGKKA